MSHARGNDETASEILLDLFVEGRLIRKIHQIDTIVRTVKMRVKQPSAHPSVLRARDPPGSPGRVMPASTAGLPVDLETP